MCSSAGVRERTWALSAAVTGARSSLSPLARQGATSVSLRAHGVPLALDSYDWRIWRAKWMPCETSSPECDVCWRRGCFPAHSSGISNLKARRWIGAAIFFFNRHCHGTYEACFNFMTVRQVGNGCGSLTVGRNGHFTRSPVRVTGEDWGIETERRAYRWTGVGAGPERWTHPEASEWVRQIPISYKTGNATSPQAECPSGAAEDQETGDLSRTYSLWYSRPQSCHPAFLPKEPTVGATYIWLMLFWRCP